MIDASIVVKETLGGDVGRHVCVDIERRMSYWVVNPLPLISVTNPLRDGQRRVVCFPVESICIYRTYRWSRTPMLQDERHEIGVMYMIYAHFRCSGLSVRGSLDDRFPTVLCTWSTPFVR